MRRKDGSAIDTSYSASPIKNQAGEIVGALSMIIDITERKRAERALRESEERYRVVAETATDVIITIDEDSKILFANGAVEKVFGYAVSELLGEQITMLMPEYLRHVHEAAVGRYVETGRKRINGRPSSSPACTRAAGDSPRDIFRAVQQGRETFLHGHRPRHHRAQRVEEMQVRRVAQMALPFRHQRALPSETPRCRGSSKMRRSNSPAPRRGLRPHLDAQQGEDMLECRPAPGSTPRRRAARPRARRAFRSASSPRSARRTSPMTFSTTRASATRSGPGARDGRLRRYPLIVEDRLIG
jgi:PAS domain S-box-containing protein